MQKHDLIFYVTALDLFVFFLFLLLLLTGNLINRLHIGWKDGILKPLLGSVLKMGPPKRNVSSNNLSGIESDSMYI